MWFWNILPVSQKMIYEHRQPDKERERKKMDKETGWKTVTNLFTLTAVSYIVFSIIFSNSFLLSRLINQEIPYQVKGTSP